MTAPSSARRSRAFDLEDAPLGGCTMLTTQQKVLRRFWYAVIPLEDLAGGPKPFRLMGEDIVLFLGADGKPAALKDRCCHRTARLSKGWCKDGNLVCGYHGWTYDRTGKVVFVPQLLAQQ